MWIDITRADTDRLLRRFMEFPYRLHRKHSQWIPPLRKEQWDWIYHRNTPLFRDNPTAFFLALSQGRVIGRIAVVEDRDLNERKQLADASFAFLDFENNPLVLPALMDACRTWARLQGLNRLVGPVSPTRGDDFRGMLIRGGFGDRPVLMNVWNPLYYVSAMEAEGFVEHYDLVAYFYNLKYMDLDRKMKVMERARKRYGFRLDPINLRDLENEARDIRQIIERAIPDWFEMVVPSLEDMQEMALRLKRFADPNLIHIARSPEGEPIGFNLALPDYNSVLQHLHGRLGPLGLLKYLWYRRRIRGARSFVMFVVPEWRRKGVAHGLYLKAFAHAYEQGYTYGEGSTIAKINIPMRRDAESVGGQHYRTYRIWEKNLS